MTRSGAFARRLRQLASRKRNRQARSTPPLGDGIEFTEDDRRVLPTPRRRTRGSTVPAVAEIRPPPHSALRECLAIQADAPRRSHFSRLFGVDPLAKEARRSFSGAQAERRVVRTLAELGDEWTVLHSVVVDPAGSEDRLPPRVDHLVVGPAGVFAIRVHAHSGQSVWVGETTFIVDDARLSLLVDAEELGIAVGRRLSGGPGVVGPPHAALVTPCLVLDSPAELRINQRPGRVEVVTGRSFGSWLNSLPRLLSPAAVERIASVACEATTWPDDDDGALPERATESARAVAEFERLERRVASCHLRRLIWSGIGVVLCYALVLSSAGALSIFGVTDIFGN